MLKQSGKLFKQNFNFNTSIIKTNMAISVICGRGICMGVMVTFKPIRIKFVDIILLVIKYVLDKINLNTNIIIYFIGI